MYTALANPQQRYRQQGVLTANPVELIVMLYDGGIKQLKIAGIAITAKEIEKANICLQKAEMIVLELINSLDLHYEIARELLRIYEYIINEIIKINAEKNIENIPNLVGLLEDLRDAWKTIAKEGASSMILADGE